MADHQHNAYEIYDVATSSDLRNAVSLTEGLRFDLGQAEGLIRELETETADLRHDVSELRLQADEIGDLKRRVHVLQSVLSKYLADAGQTVAAQAVSDA